MAAFNRGLWIIMSLFVFGKVYLLVTGSSDEDEEQSSDDKCVVATVHMKDEHMMRMKFCGLLYD